jgi:hypothetical protein
MSETNNDRRSCSRHEEYDSECFNCQYKDLRARINPEEYNNE